MKDEINEIMKQSKALFFAKLAISSILRGLLLVIPIFYSYAIEEITNGNLSGAIRLAIFLLLVTIVYYISEIVNDYVYEKYYTELSNKLTKIAVCFTEKNSIYSLSRIALGEYHSIMTADIDVIADSYASIPMAVARCFELIYIFYYFFIVNLLVGGFAVIVSLLVLVILYYGNKKVNEINKQDKATHDQRLGVLQEYFLGMKEIKGFRLFHTINRRIEKIYKIYLNWHTKYGFSKVVLKNLVLGVVDLFKIAFLFYGFYLVSNGNLTIAVVLLIYTYFEKLNTCFTGLLDFNAQWQNAKVARNRMYKLKEFSSNGSTDKHEKIIGRGYVDFDNIVYGNREDPILNHFTAHMNSNSITVITGPTGAGKTGIIDLLLKLNHQHEGSITIDKVDINEYVDDIYFSSVAAVRKNPSFFNMSIRDNLQILEPDFEKIVRVCEEVGVHDDIMKLKDGYDTIISESASNVTTDIKYLLSIVRVVLKNPKILLFDETLNAFPKEIDLQLMDYFRKTKGKHNVIIISKEKHVIEDSDQVIYMEKGTVVASGKHETLILKNGDYQKYFNEL